MKNDREKSNQEAELSSDQLLSKLYKTHSEDVFQFVRSLIKEESLANDLVQETFTKAYLAIKKRNNADFLTSEKSWLFKIAHNCFYSYIKKEKRERTKLTKAAKQNELKFQNKKLRSQEEDKIDQKMLYEAFIEHLYKLDINLAETFSLKNSSKMTHQQMAKILKTTTKTIQRRLRKIEIEAQNFIKN